MDLKTAKDRYGMGNGYSYRLYMPEIAAEASQIYFDIFNATASTSKILIKGIYAVVKSDVAATGVVSVRMDVFRTSAIGTGGTTATADGTATNAATFTKLDSNAPALNSSITARKEPTGGATSAAILDYGMAFSEETSVGSHMREFYNLIKGDQVLVLHQGQGIKVVQGSVLSVNSIGFVVDFEVV